MIQSVAILVVADEKLWFLALLKIRVLSVFNPWLNTLD